jgi:hypothetical protein
VVEGRTDTTSTLQQNQWSRFLEKLTVPQLIQEITRIYETRRFITLFKTACHLTLSWDRWLLSTSSYPTPQGYVPPLYHHQSVSFEYSYSKTNQMHQFLNYAKINNLRNWCIWLVLLWEYITMHGPMNVKCKFRSCIFLFSYPHYNSTPISLKFATLIKFPEKKRTPTATVRRMQ